MDTERAAAALDGRYRIERRLGEGGMATVYLAFDQKHDRRVALKVLKPELAAVLGVEAGMSPPTGNASFLSSDRRSGHPAGSPSSPTGLPDSLTS